MNHFSKNLKDRAWVGTVQIANMKKLGLEQEQYENPKILAAFLCRQWEDSGKDRKAAVSICESKEGLYHAHVALYGNLTTLSNVSRILGDSHIEPQKGGKKALAGYLLKEPPYDEKGETVLYTSGLENIQDNKKKISISAELPSLIEAGLTPQEIFKKDFRYRIHQKAVLSAFLDKRLESEPIRRKVDCTWILGESGTGKSHYFDTLCEQHGLENIYFCTDFENGGFDYYIEHGAPHILFMDEFKGNVRFAQLLVMLDENPRAQIHSRYANCYCLWDTVYITSIYPPEEAYNFMVDPTVRDRDKLKQLLRRLTTIRYCYKEGEHFRSYSMPASEYTNYEDLKQRALGDKDGFMPVDETEKLPFE